MSDKCAVGYIRVSTTDQAREGESLYTQRKAIEDFAASQGYKLVEIYSDEGISGSSIDNRISLKNLLKDAQQGKFDVLIIHRLSRLGRNSRDLLNHVDLLEKSGVKLVSLKEQIDMSTPYGRALFTMLGAIAQLEREIIAEQSSENRVARAKKGTPTAGTLPFARSFNRETGEWTLDENLAQHIRWAAKEYLNGASLRDLSDILVHQHKLPLKYDNLIKVLSKRSGDTWTIKFNGQEPITYKIPPILDEKTIQAVRQRLEHNRKHNRLDVRRYALTGFIYCDECGKALVGQTQIDKKIGKEFPYYRHPGGRWEECKALSSIPVDIIENAVLRTIFENTYDEAGFEKAIQESLPDKDYIDALHEKIAHGEKEIKRIDAELDQLVNLVLEGTLSKETVKKKEATLYETRSRVAEELKRDRQTLKSLPNFEKLKLESKILRMGLLDYFGSEERMLEMSFDEKKQFLHRVFNGKDEIGKPYGIYVKKTGKDTWEYFIYTSLFHGIRTVKGDNINYREHIPQDEGYKRPVEVDEAEKEAREAEWDEMQRKKFKKVRGNVKKKRDDDDDNDNGGGGGTNGGGTGDSYITHLAGHAPIHDNIGTGDECRLG